MVILCEKIAWKYQEVFEQLSSQASKRFCPKLWHEKAYNQHQYNNKSLGTFHNSFLLKKTIYKHVNIPQQYLSKLHSFIENWLRRHFNNSKIFYITFYDFKSFKIFFPFLKECVFLGLLTMTYDSKTKIKKVWECRMTS